MTVLRKSRRRTLFDAYLMVDWSANSKPKTGKDSIWYFLLRRTRDGKRTIGPHNPSTRHAALEAIQSLLEELVSRKETTLVGFDFAYGYPNGFAQALKLSGKPWRAVWNKLESLTRDDHNNGNNRFTIAGELNKELGPGEGVFWACPSSNKTVHLPTHKPKPWTSSLDEFRVTDNWLNGPQSPWKLFAPGSVGSQALLGIPYLARLRDHQKLSSSSRVWPFETSLCALDFAGYSIVHAEIYPSLIPVEVKPGQIKDAEQVETLVRCFAEVDEAGMLPKLFEGPPGLRPEQRRQVENEEGWILGVGQETLALYGKPAKT